MYPFRGWHPWPGLPPQPGWEPVGIDGEMWTATLGKAGWTTGYVTDNPHLLLPVHKRFRSKFDRVELVDGQVPGTRPRAAPRVAARARPPPAEVAARHARRAAHEGVPRAGTGPGRDEKDYNAAKVFRNGMDWIEWARTRQPFALVIDSFDAHEPWDAPRRLIDMYGDAEPARGGADPAVRHAGREGRASSHLTQRLLRRMRQLYAAEVTMVDVWLGRFLDRLENLGWPRTRSSCW